LLLLLDDDDDDDNDVSNPFLINCPLKRSSELDK
jgi:hypothetical protein